MKKTALVFVALLLFGSIIAIILYLSQYPSLSYPEFKSQCEEYAKNALVMLPKTKYSDIFAEIIIKKTDQNSYEVEYKENGIARKNGETPCYACIIFACEVIKTKMGECITYDNKTYCPSKGMSYLDALKEIAKDEIKTKTSNIRIKKVIWFLWLDGQTGNITKIDISMYPSEESLKNMRLSEIFKIETFERNITFSASFPATEQETHLLEFPLSIFARKETKITVPNKIISYSVSNATACSWDINVLSENSLIIKSTCGSDNISVPIGKIYFK
jgi:hypothetical protein